jgi:hypothetical protein
MRESEIQREEKEIKKQKNKEVKKLRETDVEYICIKKQKNIFIS